MKDNFLYRLMVRSNLPHYVKLLPEQLESIKFADYLRHATLNSNMHAIWFHAANEAKRSRTTALILKAMGLIPGTSDYFFGCTTGSAAIEMKSAKGTIQPNQHDFAAWCNLHGVKHAYCYSAAEAIAKLIEWEILEC